MTDDFIRQVLELADSPKPKWEDLRRLALEYKQSEQTIESRAHWRGIVLENLCEFTPGVKASRPQWQWFPDKQAVAAFLGSVVVKTLDMRESTGRGVFVIGKRELRSRYYGLDYLTKRKLPQLVDLPDPSQIKDFPH